MGCKNGWLNKLRHVVACGVHIWRRRSSHPVADGWWLTQVVEFERAHGGRGKACNTSKDFSFNPITGEQKAHTPEAKSGGKNQGLPHLLVRPRIYVFDSCVLHRTSLCMSS